MTEQQSFDLENLRNVGLMAHIDAGKTTVSERFLYHTGRTHEVGETHEGEATMDYMEEEKDRGITITSAATQFEWKDNTINLIDTPGHVDFTVEVERCLRVLDGAVGIFCGVGGVESQSETVWRQAERYDVPRMAFVNKMDREIANYGQAIQEMKDRLNARPVPFHWPLSKGDDFGLVLDIFNEQLIEMSTDVDQEPMPVDRDLTEEEQELLNEKREALIEGAADYDDAIFEKVIEGEHIGTDEIKAAVRKGTIAGELTPVFCGSALKNQGMHPLLNAICDFLPSPLDRKEIEGTDPDTEEIIKLECDRGDDAPFVAMAFKSHSSPTGDLTFIRIYSGSIETGEKVLNPRTGEMERIGRMAVIHADDQQQISRAEAGNIVGVVGLDNTATGDTLCSPDHEVVLGALEVPKPVISLAVKAKDRNDREKLTKALASVSREDPSFELETDQESGELVISGMGELHLEVVLDRIQAKHGIDVERSAPQVSYRKTLRDEQDVYIRHQKQSGGRGEFGEVYIEFEPMDLKGEVKFEESIRGGGVPTEFIPSVEKGIREYAEDGQEEDIPLVNFRAELYDGEHHPVDSSEVAFKTAGRKAITKAVERSGIVVLEPIMDLEARVPEGDMGDVMNELNTRRATIQETMGEEGIRKIRADVPLAEMFQFSTVLRSLTEGRGTYSMEFDRFQPVPEQMNDEILKERRKEASPA